MEVKEGISARFFLSCLS